MRRTYAYKSIIIGFLVGLLIAVSSENIVLAVVVGLAISVVGFIVIRFLENALSKGIDKAVDKASDAYRRRKEQKAIQNGTYSQPNTTQMPQATQPKTQMPQQQTQMPQQQAPADYYSEAPAQETAAPEEQLVACPYCGNLIRKTANFCPSCGGAMNK